MRSCGDGTRGYRRGCCGGSIESEEHLTFTPACAIDMPRQMPTDKIAKSAKATFVHPLLLRNNAIMQAAWEMLPQSEAADALSAKSLIGEDERSEIKFHAALLKKKAAKHAYARERANISWVLRKWQRFIVLLILINMPFYKTLKEKKHCISENTLDEVYGIIMK